VSQVLGHIARAVSGEEDGDAGNAGVHSVAPGSVGEKRETQDHKRRNRGVKGAAPNFWQKSQYAPTDF